MFNDNQQPSKTKNNTLIPILIIAGLFFILDVCWLSLNIIYIKFLVNFNEYEM